MWPGFLAHVSRRRRAKRVGLVLSILGLACQGCHFDDEDLESERDSVRGERFRRVRSQKAREEFRRRWHAEYRRKIDLATKGHSHQEARPSGPCDRWAEFRKRAQGLHPFSVFTQAVQLILSPTAVNIVELDGRPHQLFRFALRMHPSEEPALGRPMVRPEVALTMRWVPLCASGDAGEHLRILRLRIAKRAPVGRLGLQIRLFDKDLPPIAPGEPVELLLDPAAGIGHQGRDPRGSPGTGSPIASLGSAPPPGFWEIGEARIPGREHLRRLELDTSAFGDRLRRITAVEVRCPGPSGRCRFLTITEKHRELPIELTALLGRSAPITSEAEARQLWAVLMTLRYPACNTGEHRPVGRRHPCLDPAGLADREPCQFWLALNGFPTRLAIQGGQQRIEVSQVISCPGPRHRVLRVEAVLGPGANLRLRETDLTDRSAALEAELLRIIR